MFYISNVHEWFREIMHHINAKRLSPTDSTFMLFLFSSLDDEMLEFFKTRKDQISSYSGQNVHIFTPIVYGNDVIPDGEWRMLRTELNEMNIRVGNRPSMLLFKIEEQSDSTYAPNFIGAYTVDESSDLRYLVRDLIDLALSRSGDPNRLAADVESLMRSPNLIRDLRIKEYSFLSTIQEQVSRPRVFISHSSKDKHFVNKLASGLTDADISMWIDEVNVIAGDEITSKIRDGINESSFFIFVVSQDSVVSEWVKLELYQVLGKLDKKKIIPVVIDKDAYKTLPDTLTKLRELRYLDFSDTTRWKENMEELIKAVRGW